mmetsp:Transcript_24578/g.48380  ORF Transcript_24578/g.48380 Transcript_24578/m.48380 type:complete len:201 (+) Transcript_24578:214-816(+)
MRSSLRRTRVLRPLPQGDVRDERLPRLRDRLPPRCVPHHLHCPRTQLRSSVREDQVRLEVQDPHSVPQAQVPAHLRTARLLRRERVWPPRWQLPLLPLQRRQHRLRRPASRDPRPQERHLWPQGFLPRSPPRLLSPGPAGQSPLLPLRCPPFLNAHFPFRLEYPISRLLPFPFCFLCFLPGTNVCFVTPCGFTKHRGSPE